MGFRPFRKTVIDWNAAYLAGNYDGYQDDFQWGRYALMGNLIRRSGASRILDVGCGYGMLRDFIPSSSAYTGIDISGAALAQTKINRTPGDRFIECDVEMWEPDSIFDALVWSEVLYYLKDARGTLKRVSGAMSRGGLMIASFFNHPSSNANFRAFEETLTFFSSDGLAITHQFSIATEFPSHNAWSIIASRNLRAEDNREA